MDKKIVKNSLGFDTGLNIYQNKEEFNYSIDTILLANFASLNKNTKKVLEVGTNNGALALLLAQRHPKIIIDAIEILKSPFELAKKNIKINSKEKQINLILDDFRKYAKRKKLDEHDKYDLIVCNPPFYSKENFKPAKKNIKRLNAIFDDHLSLEELIESSSKIIKQKGYLSIVIPVERFIDACVLMRKFKFEPKRIQFVHPRKNVKANLVLVEGRYLAGWGTFFLKNIYLHKENKKKHEYREEIKKMYKMSAKF